MMQSLWRLVALWLAFRFVAATEDCFWLLESESGPKLQRHCPSDQIALPSNWRVKVAYNESVNTTGWAYLELETNGDLDDYEQAYWAGYAEGQLTAKLILDYVSNVWKPFCLQLPEICQRIDSYFVSNGAWIKQMVTKYAKTKSYWHHVQLFYTQMNGMYDGLISYTGKDQENILSYHDIYMINMLWDLQSLADAFSDSDSTSRANLGSCSAIVKLLDDRSDLIAAHNTWTEYNTMLRILKKYKLRLRETGSSEKRIAGGEVTFSSYPGVISSGDDFYLSGSGLVVMETTNGVYDKTLYGNLRRDSVMVCVRSVVANRLASSGSEWVDTFRQWNSGTYNNQWMIVDYNKFKPGKDGALPKGLLWIAEQLPGFFISEDVTEVLAKNGYWASYNVPYNEYIYNISGYRRQYNKYGDWFSYDRCPRAKIFKREQTKVRDVATMMQLLRYNDYLNDNYSTCEACIPKQNACNSIAARCELNPRNGTYPFFNLEHRLHGATDGKVWGLELSEGRLEPMVVSGPSRGHLDQLPAFDWNLLSTNDTVPHTGLPLTWNFKPHVHRWQLPTD